MNIYRISPILWNDATPRQNDQMAITVYCIDRPPANLKTTCSSRPKEDPAYYWDSATFSRLTLPDKPYVTWSDLPRWLSYAFTQGYTLVGNIGKPYDDLYIQGP